VIDSLKTEKIIVFCNSAETAEELQATLLKNEFRSGVFYGSSLEIFHSEKF